MKKRNVIMGMIICLTVFTCCQASFHSEKREVSLLMEKTKAPWAQAIEKDCGIGGFGKPFGTTKESFEKKAGMWQVTFEIDEEMTMPLLEGYVKGVFLSCVKANGGRVKSSGGFLYDDFRQTERRQIPLPYYIWYYSVNQVIYRVGIYPINLEENIGGGLILRIEKWD